MFCARIFVKNHLKFMIAFVVYSGFLIAASNGYSHTLTPRLQQAAASGLLVEPKPNLYVLGTVHIGSESALEVEELIEVVKPDTVIIEVAPSRLQSLRQKAVRNNDNSPEEKQPKTDPISAILSWPAFASRGWSAGGFLGFVFVSAVLWPGFVKRSLTASEEEIALPRRDEFAAAIEAAISLYDEPTIIAADAELDELILGCSKAMSIGDWIQFGYREGVETPLGLRPKDPIRRISSETLEEWAKRRRLVDTARASKKHGEEVSPSFSSVLVNQRDARFASACLDSLELQPQQTIVCIVGLVHVEGICANL